jgi:MFS superfamily sulfate permease-like transporter
MQVGANLSIEKPRNGVAGLKHWRNDVVAGLVVSLISLPFSLGIAVASGAPPICGLISAIIAGLVLPFLGGSYVTISGPAAGLAPALLAAMLLLGRGNLEIGYPLLLGAICLTGLVQIVLARLKLARFSAIFPASVVEGMLASIGLLIIAKQLPLLFGHKFASHEFWGIVREAPSQFLRMDPKVFFVGIFCLALIFGLASLKARWLKVMPPQVIAAGVGLVLGRLLGLGGEHLIHIPDHPFAHGIVLPNFAGLIADHTLWWALATTVLTLTMIDGIESLATISAIDKIDPFRRKSDPNRTLFAMGVSNMCSSMAGGLTIIPGGVKSTACIVSGGRTQWANFYNALFLTAYLLIGRNLINLIPLSALGAIVLFTGYKLCAPKVWKHIAAIGSEQLFVFTTTVLVTVSTDLLWGIAAGVVAKLVVESLILAKVMRDRPEGHQSLVPAVNRWLRQTGELFRDPVVQSGTVGNTYHLYFGRPLVCFNAMHLDAALARIPTGVTTVCLHVTDLVTLIDHTAAGALLDFVEDFRRTGRGIAQIVGLDRLQTHSHAESALRVSAPILAQERARALTELSRLSMTRVSTEVPDATAFLERISLTHVRPIEGQDDHVITEALIRAWRYLARMSTAALGFIRLARIGNGVVKVAHIRDLAWFSLGNDEAEAFTSHHSLAWFSLSKEDREDFICEFGPFSRSVEVHPPRHRTDESRASDLRWM